MPSPIRFPRLDNDQLQDLTVILSEMDEFKGRWRRLGSSFFFAHRTAQLITTGCRA
jgi:hypothetical protein